VASSLQKNGNDGVDECVDEERKDHWELPEYEEERLLGVAPSKLYRQFSPQKGRTHSPTNEEHGAEGYQPPSYF